MKDEIIYFSVNNWFEGRDYPPTDNFRKWLRDDFQQQFKDDKWAKENKLCIAYELIDQSMNYCITASKKWVEENCPRLLTHYQQFLRGSENNEARGHWGTKFLEYIPENFGSRYYR